MQGTDERTLHFHKQCTACITPVCSTCLRLCVSIINWTALLLLVSLPAWLSYAAGTGKTLLATACLSFHHQPESININVIVIIIITSLVVFCCRHGQNPAGQGCCWRGGCPLLLQVSLHSFQDCLLSFFTLLVSELLLLYIVDLLSAMTYVSCTELLGSL